MVIMQFFPEQWGSGVQIGVTQELKVPDTQWSLEVNLGQWLSSSLSSVHNGQICELMGG